MRLPCPAPGTKYRRLSGDWVWKVLGVNDRSLAGVNTLTKEQSNLLVAITLKKPTKKEQLSLL